MLRKAQDIATLIIAVVAMMAVPPLAGMTAYGFWLRAPLPFDPQIPAGLAGVWAAVVIAAIIRRGFE